MKKSDKQELVWLSLVSFETVVCLLLTVFCAFRLETIEAKNLAQIEQVRTENVIKIEQLEKQIQEYQERNERLIKTNLDIFINHRWE